VSVVTVSRQYGAGGLRVATALAEALGFRKVDRELAEQAAIELGVDPEIAEAQDERPPAIIEQLGMALAAGGPPFGTMPPEATVDDRTLAEATRRVIVGLADAGGYVVLGRGAAAALAGRPDACNLSLVGDLPDRAARIMRLQGVDRKQAVERCRRVDAERTAYVKRFYGRDIRDPLLYDAVLNTTLLGLDAATELATGVAMRKLGIG